MNDLTVILIALYLFLVATITKIGSKRVIGSTKAFLYSLFLTPIGGLIAVVSSERKDVLHIVHYKCHRCGLEYTTFHRHCPACRKENVRVRLHRKTMHTY